MNMQVTIQASSTANNKIDVFFFFVFFFYFCAKILNCFSTKVVNQKCQMILNISLSTFSSGFLVLLLLRSLICRFGCSCSILFYFESLFIFFCRLYDIWDPRVREIAREKQFSESELNVKQLISTSDTQHNRKMNDNEWCTFILFILGFNFFFSFRSVFHFVLYLSLRRFRWLMRFCERLSLTHFWIWFIHMPSWRWDRIKRE